MNNTILFTFAVVIVLSWLVHPCAAVVPAVEAVSYILDRKEATDDRKVR